MMNKDFFRFRFVYWFFFLIVSHSAFSGENNNSVVSQQLNSLTKQLIESNTLHPAQTKSLKNTAQLRLHAIQANLALYPNEVLDVVLSKEAIARMDVSVQPLVEKTVSSLKGTFVQMCALEDKHAQRYYLKVNDKETYALYFASVPEQLPNTGEEVVINQAYLFPVDKNDFAVQGYLLLPLNQQVITKINQTAPLYPTTGDFKTLVFLVNFQNEPNNKPYSVASVYAMLKNVNDYFYENSSQKTTLSTNVVGWYTIPYDSTVSCDSITQAMVSNATAQANAAGVDVSSYRRRIFLFPRMKSCGWAGLGYIGGGDRWGISWVNGHLSLIVMGHELGHNFGLNHARALTCTGGTIAGACNYNDSSVGAVYGDTADIMGNRFPGHFNAKEKESLGWLDSPGFPGIATVTANGTFNLSPYETLTQDIKALRIAKTSPVTNASTYYYLEYRQPIGFDAGLGNNLTNGLLIHEGVRGTNSSTYLLDAVPDGGNFSNAALAPGNLFHDPNAPGGGVTVSVNSADTTRANVTVTFGSASACVRAAPIITVSPSDIQLVNAGNAASYTFTLTNKDSPSCGNGTFDLKAAPVADVTATLSNNNVSVAPGAAVSTQLMIQSSTSTPQGVYSVQVNGYNRASPSIQGAGVAKMQVQIPCTQTNPSIILSPTTQTARAGSTVNYTVSVSNKNPVSCPAASYNLAAQIPSGFTAAISPNTLTLNSNASASGVLSLTSAATLPASTYGFNVKASNTANSALSASVAGQYITTSQCVYAAPTVTITPSNASTSGTNPVIYNFSLKNNHSPACGYGLFRFSRQTDDGNIAVSMNANGALILPNEVYNGTITVTPNALAKIGSHQLSITTDIEGGTKLVSPYSLNYLATPSCVRANPTMSIFPSTQTGAAGGTVNYAIHVTNKDSAGCAAQQFNVATVFPTNLFGTVTPSSLVLSPGASAAAVLKVSSYSNIPSTNYNLTTKVTSSVDASLSTSATVQYNTLSQCVYKNPTITITPNSQTTSGTNAVKYNLSLTNNNSSACAYSRFRFARETDDYNVPITMTTNGEGILAGQTMQTVITVTPNLKARLGPHTLTLKTDLQDGTILQNQFNVMINKP